MAENNLLFYRGFPLVKEGKQIFYGSMGDTVVARLTVSSTETCHDVEVPTKVKVQLMPLDGDIKKMKKADCYGLREAMDMAYDWLCAALFD